MQSTDMPQFDEQEPSVAATWLKRIAIAVVIIIVIGALGYALKALMSGGGPQKKAITTIKLLPDTPPPPPPPPKEPPKEQPKDQPKEVKEVPQPKPEQTPPAEVLKMEGAAGDSPSPFQAGTVSNEYTGGEVGTKIGGGPSKYQFAWYTNLIKNQIEDALAKDKALANGTYKIVVKLWIASTGRIQKYELAGSSGDAATDVLIKKALDEMPPLSDVPPGDMPQPVKLRITARAVG
ncbi:MAG: TonB C-terminal domain-containing protein [Candidatus Methylopumilus sp.]|jgi:outer membrane biosynthesis protein TonB